MDTLSTIVALLKPQAHGAKLVHGAGRWGVRYAEFGHPSYALVLKGPCWLAAEGAPARTLETGDFILFPATPRFTLASDAKVRPKLLAPVPSGRQMEEVVHGDSTMEPSASLLGGYFMFDPVNASILTSLLPKMLHLHAGDPAADSLAPLVGLIKREALGNRPGQSLVLNRLVEVLLVEALRSAPSETAAKGLLAGLQDSRLAAALQAIHTRPAHPWTLDTLAREASMSRSSFAEHFARVMEVTPLRYLLQWRLTMARDLLSRGDMTVAETALAVGYESASGFSIAFNREIGQPPVTYKERSKKTSNRVRNRGCRPG
ncbi:AraC family transcriptional regulator [Luteolibacter ambystomatis]|uniref:AraC family transcriptional regulator n=1 Tax=Luteolibacter ambystomatis TaxID=2824561 RepID=A0A975J2J3_9BACT|nr:AraC family transcriptional regulator [Luteolibacter ambystomatis]QUE52875.1 AraC family transcriptional regulator [Luteolibacter ambystomatis]